MRSSQSRKGGALRGPASSVSHNGARFTRETPNRKRIGSLVSSAPLVGRESILPALCEPLRNCSVVLGEPGIGKTRLLAEARRNLGYDVFDIACVAAASEIPHDPLIGLLRGLKRADRIDGRVVDSFVKSSECDRMAYFHDTLADIAATRQITIQIDDLHLADAKSLETVEYCIARLQDLPIIWHLASRRSSNAVLTLASSLERAGLALVVTLTGLTRAELKLLAVHLRPEVAFDDAQLSRLHERTAGNPLYAELLLVGRVYDDLAVPSDLRETLRRRLSELSTDALHIAGWLAVHRDPLPEAQLATLAGRSPAHVRGALAELSDAWIICEAQNGLAFRHELLREALYVMLDDAGRTARHQALVDRAQSPWQRATHLEGAGDFAEAARLFTAMGWDCLDRHAPHEALKAFGRAVDRVHPSDPLSLEAIGGQAAALFRLGETDTAWKATAKFDDQASLLAPEVVVSVRTRCLEAAWEESDDQSALFPMLLSTVQLARESSHCMLPRLLYVLGSMLERRGELASALKTLEEGVELCGARQDRREFVRLRSWLGVVLARLGQIQKGLAVLEAAASHAQSLGMCNELAQCCVKLCYVYHLAGDHAGYERSCRRGLALDGPKSMAAESVLRANLASVAIDRGQLREALGLTLSATLPPNGSSATQRWRLLSMQAQLYAMLGDFEAAQRTIDDGMRLDLSRAARRSVAFTAGFVAELRDDCEQALNWYSAAVSTPSPDDCPEVYEVRSLAGIVRLAAMRGDGECARAALEKLRHGSATGSMLARRITREAEGCLLLVEGDLTGADTLVEAANEGEYPFWKAHLQLIAAHAKADRNLFLTAIDTFDALGAEFAADRARALARSHGLRPGRKREAKGTLSARETSVAFLVAGGKTNAEIGELLHISAKTVEYHIGNILSKCGLRSRIEIATQIAAGRTLGSAAV